MPNLGPHQVKAIDSIVMALRNSVPRVRVELATGSGKSTIQVFLLDRLLRTHQIRSALVLTDHIALAHQLLSKFRDFETTAGVTIAQIAPVFLSTSPSSLVPDNAVGASFVVVAASGALVDSQKGKSPTAVQDEVGQFDLVILDDTAEQSQFTLLKLVQKSNRVVAFASTPRSWSDKSFGMQTIYRYTLAQAIDEGTIIPYSNTRPTVSGIRPLEQFAWPGQVLLQCVNSDLSRVNQIRQDINEAGAPTGILVSEPQRFSDPRARADQISPNDILITLLSRASLNDPMSDPSDYFLLTRRGIDVVPVLLEECEIPASWHDRGLVSAVESTEPLIRSIRSRRLADFSRLSPHRFVRLIEALFSRLGFEVVKGTPDYPVDLHLRHTNRLGFQDEFDYFVTIELSLKRGISVGDMGRFARVVASAGKATRGILVTNRVPTSAYVQSLGSAATKLGIELRVIDGSRIRELLSDNPDLTEWYFGARSLE